MTLSSLILQVCVKEVANYFKAVKIPYSTAWLVEHCDCVITCITLVSSFSAAGHVALMYI